MKCAEIEELIIRDAFEKLNALDQERLQNHLQDCTSCCLAMEENQQMKLSLTKLQSIVPIPTKKDSSIAEIINALPPDEIRERHNSADLFTRKIVRNAINIAAIFLIGLFAVQQYEIQTNLKDLNSKIENQENANQQSPNKLSELQIIQFTNNPELPEAIKISPTQLNQLMNKYEFLIEENSEMTEFLKTYHNDVYQEFLKTQQRKANDKLNL